MIEKRPRRVGAMVGFIDEGRNPPLAEICGFFMPTKAV